MSGSKGNAWPDDRSIRVAEDGAVFYAGVRIGAVMVLERPEHYAQTWDGGRPFWTNTAGDFEYRRGDAAYSLATRYVRGEATVITPAPRCWLDRGER